MAVATYLVDKSAYARGHHPLVRARLEPLILHGRVATCSLVDLELAFSTRTATEHSALLLERRGFEPLVTEQADWDRALVVQSELARRGQTRAVGLPDLLLGAVAERHRVTVLHYDDDFDLLSAVTGQPVEWVVAQGAVP